MKRASILQRSPALAAVRMSIFKRMTNPSVASTLAFSLCQPEGVVQEPFGPSMLRILRS